MTPPLGVNLIAFPTRFERTCSRRAESAEIVVNLTSISNRSSSDAAVAVCVAS